MNMCKFLSSDLTEIKQLGKIDQINLCKWIRLDYLRKKFERKEL